MKTLFFFILFFGTWFISGQAYAATFTPTTTADTAISSTAVVNAAGQITDQGNAITLRSAVIAANAATSAAGGANTIILGAGTYVLTIPGTGETASAGNALIGDLDVLALASERHTLKAGVFCQSPENYRRPIFHHDNRGIL